MAYEVYRFFDSVNDDRIYPADEFAEFFRAYFCNGVVNTGTNLEVTAGGGMGVDIDAGTACLEGYVYMLKPDGSGTKLHLALDPADTQPRNDRIILRLDKSVANRRIGLAIKKGTPSQNALPPTLTRSGNIFEISLARARVAANAVSIADADITDERRDADLCGIVLPWLLLEYLDQPTMLDSSPQFAGLEIQGEIRADIIRANRVYGAVYG